MPRLVLLAVVLLAGIAAADTKPGTYVVVIDRSASMHGDKLELATAGVLAQLEKLSPEDRVAVVSFGKSAAVVSPLRAPTASASPSSSPRSSPRPVTTSPPASPRPPRSSRRSTASSTSSSSPTATPPRASQPRSPG
jgi:hypothetical protein